MAGSDFLFAATVPEVKSCSCMPHLFWYGVPNNDSGISTVAYDAEM